MNILKFGYGIVLDGLPVISEFHFFWGLGWGGGGGGGGSPQTRFSLIVVFIFQKSLILERHMS